MAEEMDPETGELRDLALGLVKDQAATAGAVRGARIAPEQLEQGQMIPWSPPKPTQSDSLNELASALAKAQGEITGASKDRTNPAFQSKYATLASCWDACREPLSKNGLAVIQRVSEASRNVVSVETLLVHSSGQWVSQVVRLPVDKPTAQGVGSAITYARRYGLSAAVGVAPADDDDDGNRASMPSERPSGYVRPPTARREPKPDPRLTPEQNQQAAELFRSGR